ncbi:hypothetical protein PVK06_010004 [Gossypium arboreum]|uniref:U-box domain-containing protein n=1 Tax=Gossypium arboreum TaxID=29729 RepID=A0ABR0QP40_GOSAR|nr:hypothetical protein PVK06_010004 [Gossypium arboreum]
MDRKKESVKTREEIELKKELGKVVKKILKDEDYGFEITIEAIRILSCLAEIKMKKPVGPAMDDTSVVEKLKSPLLDEIMSDIVVLVPSQTYDRPQRKKQSKEHNLTCPPSIQEVNRDIVLKTSTEADRSYLNSLLEMMSSLVSDQKQAAKELRRLTKTTKSYKAALCESTNNIPRLLSPLSKTKFELDPDLQEDLITTIFNISLHANNKKQLSENPVVIPLLTESMKFGTIKTRRNAAATLLRLSALDSNKFIIGNSGVVAPLLELLHEGHPSAMNDVALAIFSLCKVSENRTKFVETGAVEVIMQKIKEGVLVDELLVILALLSTNREAIDELGDSITLQCLLRIIRDSSCECSKENCVAILYNVCSKDLTLLMVIRAEEIKKHTLVKLADTGTTRARRKAISIIAKIHKAFPAISIRKFF